MNRYLTAKLKPKDTEVKSYFKCFNNIEYNSNNLFMINKQT